MQGEIFLGEHAAPPHEYVFGARDRCDETVAMFRTVRDARYRYIKNFTPDRPFLQKNNYKAKQYPVWNLLKKLDAEDKLTPTQKFLTPTSAAHKAERLRRALAGEHLPATFELEVVHKNGQVIPVEVRARLIRTPEGHPVGYQGIYRDIRSL